MKEKTYECRVKCENCKMAFPDISECKIPVGTFISDWAKEKECPNCGCKGTLINAYV